MFSRDFFAWRLRALLPVLARLRGRSQRRPDGKILAILTGGLGDKLMALPATREFRARHHGSRLTLVFVGDALPFMEGEADEVIELPRADTAGLLRVARRGADAFFANSIAAFETRFEVAAFLCGAGERRGPRFSNIAEGRTVYAPGYVFGDGHETRINFLGAGGQCDSASLPYCLVVPDERVPQVPDVDIVFHPATSPSGLANRWPVECYAQLAQALHAMGRSVAVIGTTSELPLIKRIVAASPKTRVITGLSLRETALVLNRATLLIGNDSGIGHLAASVGVPVLTVFGANRPERVAPVSAIPGYARAVPSHCPRGGCYGTPDESACPRCITLTTVEEVLTVATELLAAAPRARQ